MKNILGNIAVWTIGICFTFGFLIFPLFSHAQSGGSIPTISPWRYYGLGVFNARGVSTTTKFLIGATATTTNSYLETPSLTITGLTSETCLGTNSAGVVIAGTCSGGGGSTTTINGVQGPTFTFNSSNAAFTYSTTSGTVTLDIATTTLATLLRVSQASTTNWNLFYDTPSNRITDGTGLTWSGNTINCDTASGSVQGCLSAADWTTFNNKGVSNWLFNGSRLAPSTTVGIGVFASSTISDLSMTNSTSTNATSTTLFSALGTFTNLVVSTLSTFLNVVVTGLLDVGGGVLEIPNGASPTCDDTGEICQDTSKAGGGQLIIDDVVFADGTRKIWAGTVASTSVAFMNDGLLPLPPTIDGWVMTHIKCKVDGGTSKVIAIEDASGNSTEDITCLTSVTSDDGSITNATFIPEEEMYVDFGATTGVVDYVSFSVYGTSTRQ